MNIYNNSKDSIYKPIKWRIVPKMSKNKMKPSFTSFFSNVNVVKTIPKFRGKNGLSDTFLSVSDYAWNI